MIRKLAAKKILLYPCVLVLAVTLALSLVTHSSCACGDKIERSLLRIIVEDAARGIRSIFN